MKKWLNRLKKISFLPFSLIINLPQVLNVLRIILFRTYSTNMLFYAAVPDSRVYFDKYPEFEDLKKKFLFDNYQNNSLDLTRLFSLVLNINHVMERNVKGNFAELGVYKGNTSAVLMFYANKYNRRMFMFDTFSGFNDTDLVDIDANQKKQFGDTSLEAVKTLVGDNSNAFYLKGYFPYSIDKSLDNQTFSFVSLDCDLYKPIKAGLEYFYPRLEVGGMIFIHDYSSCFWDGVKKAVDEFCRLNSLNIVLLPDKSGTAVLVKY